MAAQLPVDGILRDHVVEVTNALRVGDPLDDVARCVSFAGHLGIVLNDADGTIQICLGLDWSETEIRHWRPACDIGRPSGEYLAAPRWMADIGGIHD